MKTINTIVRRSKARGLSDFRTTFHICNDYNLQVTDMAKVKRLLVATKARS